ncbi:hypothetical protein JW949_04520 [Candidatus Woesearchaeota archaeon]|nr:hypothetical protein [Candidatus Woesearchaeota archaeon]
MKVRTYGSIDLTEDIKKSRENKINDVMPELIKKYSINDEKTQEYAEEAISRQLGYILWALSCELENKKILDLGCGANREKWEKNRRYEPWLCRALLIMGAKPIGIDIGNLDKEKFEHYNIDLDTIDIEKLGDKYKHSVDLANARSLFSSPIRTSKKMHLSYDVLKESLVFRIEKIIKKEGFFIYLKDW